jgi:hypothetical protein
MIIDLYCIRMSVVKKSGKFSAHLPTSSGERQYPTIVAAASQESESLVSPKKIPDTDGDRDVTARVFAIYT